MKIKREQWNIAFKYSSDPVFKIIPNGISYWVADPFPVKYKGELYLFAELYYYKKNKGVIGYSKYKDGRFGSWHIAIEEPWHLSFPFIITNENNIYICPESYKSGKYFAYIAKEFPNKWERLSPIRADGNLYVDSVFSYIDNELYFFAYHMDPDCHSKGTLYYHNLSKDKFKHPTKISTAYPRAGGNILNYNNRYIRVAQNCDLEYGQGLVFFDFQFVNGNYYEKMVRKVYPDDIKIDSNKKFYGIHTFNTCDNFQVIDLKTKEFNLIDIFFRIIRKIYKCLTNILK